MLTVFGSMLPEDHILPKTMYQATKILSALKMQYEKIHSCPNGCILFRKEHEAETYCPKCKASRFLEVDAGDGQPKRQLTIPVKIILPSVHSEDPKTLYDRGNRETDDMTQKRCSIQPR